MRCLQSLNVSKPYSEQIKPFNFLQTCHVSPFGHPEGADAEKFHLITPYNADPRSWIDDEWIDQYSGKRFRITTQGHCGAKRTARVKTYGDIAVEYEHHPEAKCADVFGNPCDKRTVGLLARRHVKVDQVKCIGKESNSLENVEEGFVHDEKNVYTEYVDPKRDEWATTIRPALTNIPLKALVERCKGQLSRRALINLRAGRSRPHRSNQKLLRAVVIDSELA